MSKSCTRASLPSIFLIQDVHIGRVQGPVWGECVRAGGGRPGHQGGPPPLLSAQPGKGVVPTWDPGTFPPRGYMRMTNRICTIQAQGTI